MAERLGISGIDVNRVLVDDAYVGDGYGLPAESTLEAITLTARLDGILLDSVYSGKGMAGLIGKVRSGYFKTTDNVLFLPTDGATALFAYEKTILGVMA